LVTDDESWSVRGTAEGTRVTPGDAPDPSSATIRAESGWLALAVYGRLRLDPTAFEIDGPASTADQFAALFGPRA
ncbi:MAG: hypothetical protein JO057_03515, partial [Chloroflexi bacterium]|nr:hypothetical protein [Chloroflexota bacterium]